MSESPVPSTISPPAQCATASPAASPASQALRHGDQPTGVRLLGDLRAEIARADSKAAVLVAALGVTAGMLGALLTGNGHRPLSPIGLVLGGVGGACLVTSLLAMLLAVLPRYRRSVWEPGRPLVFFGDIRRAAELGQLSEALAQAERDPSEGLLTALADTSEIVSRKHRWIRVGLVAFSLGSLMLPSALLIG